MNDIRIAAAICRCPVGTVSRNIETMDRLVSEAATAGVQIICFPEMNLTGYGFRTPGDILAEFIPGPVTEKIQKIADDSRITLLAGLAEKTADGRIFATQVVISPHREPELYRKLHLAPTERELFSAGKKAPLFQTHGLTFGIQLCYDAHFPELTTRLALKGADAVFFPHASPRGTPEEKFASWMRHLPARAFDNGIFAVACNQAGENGNGLQFPGIAMAIGPSGHVISRDLSGSEGLMIVDLKQSDLDAVRDHRMRYFLPNRRKDLFGE